jgi:hypothetical protein
MIFVPVFRSRRGGGRMAVWMKSCAGSYWPGVMRTSGSALYCPRRGDSTWFSSRTRWRPGGSASMRTTPGGSGEVLNGQGWPGRTLAGEDGSAAVWLLAQLADRDPVRQRTFLQALRVAVRQGRRLRRTWPTWRTGCGSMPAGLSCTAPSSLSPTENSDPVRSRIRNGWKSAVQRPDLNQSLIAKPVCEPGLIRTDMAWKNALNDPCPVTLTLPGPSALFCHRAHTSRAIPAMGVVGSLPA